MTRQRGGPTVRGMWVRSWRTCTARCCTAGSISIRETRIHPNGKLRLMYENNPLAFIVENAGGAAVNGTHRTLEIQPTSLHQRSQLFIGSIDEVRLVQEFLNGTR